MLFFHISCSYRVKHATRWGWARFFPSSLLRSFSFGRSPGNLFSSSLARKRYVDGTGVFTVAGLIVATANVGCVWYNKSGGGRASFVYSFFDGREVESRQKVQEYTNGKYRNESIRNVTIDNTYVYVYISMVSIYVYILMTRGGF